MQIRLMDAGDVPAVAALESCCLSSWTIKQVEAELDRKTGIALVAGSLAADGVQGWCCALLIGSDAELLKIAVAPQWRRRGIGGALLSELRRQVKVRGGEQIFLEVRAQNVPALKLYARLGWKEVGRRKNYYKEPVDDALVFVSSL